MQSLVQDYQWAQIRTAFSEGIEQYELDQVGDDGQKFKSGSFPEKREYTEHDSQRIIQEIQMKGRFGAVSSFLQAEIKLYEKRKSEGYTSHLALNQSRLGFELANIILEYCRTNERPFPNRADTDLFLLFSGVMQRER